MPSLGADMEFGTVTKWYVAAGDQVHRGDIMAEVQTEKATMEIEVFEDGVVEELVVGEGERVRVGAVLARIAEPAATALVTPPAPSAAQGSSAPRRRAGTRRRATTARRPAAPPTPAPARGVPTPSPVVRRLAAQAGIDVSTLAGHGAEGAVTRADVEQAAAALAASSRGAPARGAPSARVRSSPRARRVAAALGVDLTGVRGTGPGGAVVEDDVTAAGAAARTVAVGEAPVAPGERRAPAADTEEERHAALRQAVARLMARSKREIPHYYLSTTIDMEPALGWLEQANLVLPLAERLVPAALLVKATATAALAVPEMNGFMVDTRFEPSAAVHVGVAISLRGGGVIAPAVHDVDRLGVHDVMAAMRDLVVRTRRGVLRSSEMSDPTITVTNLGDLGVEAVFGVIYPPQVALVGFGRVVERPWAHEGMLGVRRCLTATLSADHRVSEGHRGALFLAEIDRLLQKPEEL